MVDGAMANATVAPMTAPDRTHAADTSHGHEFTDRAMRWLLVCVSAYIACSLMANVMSVKILRLGPTWASFSVDAGTLTYPLTFTLRDLIHKVGGRSVARVVVVSGGILNALLALGLYVASLLPGDPEVMSGAQRHFGAVLAPVTRIVLASVIAQIISELVDTEVYQRFVDRFGHRIQWGRVVSSNAVSIPLDSVIFVVIAFAGEVPFAVAVSMIWANIVVKGATTLISVPLIYVVPEGVMKKPTDANRRAAGRR